MIIKQTAINRRFGARLVLISLFLKFGRPAGLNRQIVISHFKTDMKLINLTFIIILFLTSCRHRVQKETSLNTSIDSSTIKQDEEEKSEEPDTKELRKEYIANYSKIETIDTSFTSTEGNEIHINTKYYCLFDNAIIVPKQYVWEDTTKTFKTHNYSQDIKIVIDSDTIFNKTITKAYFEDNLYPELKNYAVLMFPNFSFDKEKNVFVFGYSLTIPITDIGAGRKLIIDKKGNVSTTDR